MTAPRRGAALRTSPIEAEKIAAMIRILKYGPNKEDQTWNNPVFFFTAAGR
jgi:hypothetical protein